jgi:hypothetical protein
MFNLNDILQNAQGGNAINNLAQQFGLSPEQTQNAIQALIPALSTALQNKASDPNGLGSVISAITDKDHRDAFQNSNDAPAPDTVQKGQDVLGDLFGSNHVTTQIAQQISSVTGLRPDVIAQLAPAVTSLAIGGIAASMHNQGFGNVLGQLASAAQQGNLGSMLGGQNANPAQAAGGGLMGALMSVVGGLFGGGSQAPNSSAAAPQADALEALTKMFQPGNTSGNFDQSSLESTIGQILGGKH